MSLTSDYQDPISRSVYCVTTQFAYCIDDDIRVLIKREDKNEHKLCNSVMVLLACTVQSPVGASTHFRHVLYPLLIPHM